MSASRRRTVHIGANVQYARSASFVHRSLNDYLGLPPAYRDLVKKYSNPLLAGPPVCDELVALIEHVYTAEEAEIARHIPLVGGRTARGISTAANQVPQIVKPVLERLAHQKGVIFRHGSGPRSRFHLMPVVPGMFELTMAHPSESLLTDWHKRFAELFEALFQTGYITDYTRFPTRSIRYVPVGRSIEGDSAALPADKLEELLAPYTSFSIAICQCRLTEKLVGRGCGGPMENCVSFGFVADYLVREGRAKSASLRDVLAVKREAEEEALVTFVGEMRFSGKMGGVSCSCCPCCCKGLQPATKFGASSLIRPARFLPSVDTRKCTCCGTCAEVCPMGAMRVDTAARRNDFVESKCIGCGLCAVACKTAHAISMTPRSAYRYPRRHWLPLALSEALPYVRNAWNAWRHR